MQGRFHSGGGGRTEILSWQKKEEDKGRIKKGLLLKLRSVQLFFPGIICATYYNSSAEKRPYK